MTGPSATPRATPIQTMVLQSSVSAWAIRRAPTNPPSAPSGTPQQNPEYITPKAVPQSSPELARKMVNAPMSAIAIHPQTDPNTVAPIIRRTPWRDRTLLSPLTQGVSLVQAPSMPLMDLPQENSERLLQHSR